MFADEKDRIMNRKASSREKIHKFADKHTLWVCGGNHHYKAYHHLDKMQIPDPHGLHANVLTLVYWWPDYSPSTIQEVTLLAAQQNSDGSLHAKMEFKDKVHK